MHEKISSHQTFLARFKYFSLLFLLKWEILKSKFLDNEIYSENYLDELFSRLCESIYKKKLKRNQEFKPVLFEDVILIG